MTINVNWSRTLIAAYVFGFLALCAGTAFGMIQTITWYLDNCNLGSSACTAADLLISYWWSLFIPLILALTYLVQRISMKRQSSPS